MTWQTWSVSFWASFQLSMTWKWPDQQPCSDFRASMASKTFFPLRNASVNIIMLIPDVLASNRCQSISNHRANYKVKRIISCIWYSTEIMSQSLDKQCLREIRRLVTQLVTLLLAGTSSHSGNILWPKCFNFSPMSHPCCHVAAEFGMEARLLHNSYLVALGLSVEYETWPPIDIMIDHHCLPLWLCKETVKQSTMETSLCGEQLAVIGVCQQVMTTYWSAIVGGNLIDSGALGYTCQSSTAS